MTNSVLHFFVDTNLFIQCRPLEELDWSSWREFDEVRLIVSPPVLREIDHLKTRGNDRVGRRARKTLSMFREMLNEPKRTIQLKDPRVVLSIEHWHKYSQDEGGRLDFRERDDQLLGTIYAFHQSIHEGSNDEVRLLTHDTTPLYTAQSIKVATDRIPDKWLLPPERSGSDRRLAALEKENAQLRSTEPSISVICKDQSGKDVECYSATFTWFKPLTDTQVNDLMQRLKAWFPRASKFNSSEPLEAPKSAHRTVRLPKASIVSHQTTSIPQWLKDFSSPDLTIPLPQSQRTFVPPTAHEIENYRRMYPRWLENCEEILRTHHDALQEDIPFPVITFLAKNSGTRPASDVLVMIEALGGFQIKPPSTCDDEERKERQDDARLNLKVKLLPRPPVVPVGSWQSPRDSQRAHSIHAFGSPHPLSERSHSGFAHARPTRLKLTGLSSQPRDPSKFYFEHDRPSTPQNSFALECAMWRHDDQLKSFIAEIHFPTDGNDVEGSLVCSIQATNLSQPASCHIPVRIMTSRISAFESARGMVDALIDNPDS